MVEINGSHLSRALWIFLAGWVLLAGGLTVARRASANQVERAATASAKAPVALSALAAPGVPRAAEGAPPRDREWPARPPSHRNLADRRLLADPEYAQCFAAHERPTLDLRYGRLFQKLDLTSEARTQLKDLLGERNAAKRDAGQVAQALGLPNSRDAASVQNYRMLMADVSRDITQKIGGLLGAEGVEELQKFENTLPERDELRPFQIRLDRSEAPLSDEIFDQLAELPGQVRMKRALEKAGFQSSRFKLPEEFVVRAATILTPLQHAVLRQVNAEAEAKLEIGSFLAARTSAARK